MFSTRSPNLVAALAVAGLAVAPAGVVSADEPVVRFVSVPDFVNMDLQYEDPRLFDLTEARQAQLVAEINDGGPQALINPTVGNYVGTVENGYRGASQVLLESIGAEDADFFAVSGDMLYTRWPKGSQLGQAGAEQHILDQADIYYDGWVDSVRDYAGYDYALGEVFTVIGDHEVGDNNWPAAKRALIPTYQQVYVDKLGGPQTVAGGAYVDAPTGLEGRAYAVQRGNLLLVGIDQFADINSITGPVDVTGSQLTWLDDTLAAANNDATIEHIVVLGHTPIADPNEVAIGFSSGLMNDTDDRGPLWGVFADRGVDLYLPGEVHAISVQEARGVLQVVNGTNIFQPTGGAGSVPEAPYDQAPLTSEQNYLVVDAYADRLELTLKGIETKIWGFRGLSNDPLNDDPYKDREARVEAATAAAGFQTIGTMTINTSGGAPTYTDRTGAFLDFVMDTPLVTHESGEVPIDAGTGTSLVMPGYNRVDDDGSTEGLISVRFETNLGVTGLDSRDRGPLASGQSESHLARDFVFGDRRLGADYLDIAVSGLEPREYRFEGLFHEVLDTAQSDLIAVDVDTGAGFTPGAQATLSTGLDPESLGIATFDFSAGATGDVVFRITNLGASGPHLINSFRLIPLIAGDYNADGVVDAADYTLWRDALGSTTDLRADGDRNGVVDIADYEVWETNYGATLGDGPTAPANVPEPTAALLLAGALIAANGRARRGQRSASHRRA